MPRPIRLHLEFCAGMLCVCSRPFALMLCFTISVPAEFVFAQESSDNASNDFASFQQVAAVTCLDCHSGEEPESGFSLDSKPSLSESLGALSLKEWERLIHSLENRSMPPADATEIDDEQREASLVELRQRFFEELQSEMPPRTAIRRMNRFQYNNAVQDLFQLKVDVFALPERMAREYGYFDPSSRTMPARVRVGSRPLGKSQLIGKRLAGVAPFPQDLRAENGFDNDAALLSLSPLLMESFLRLSKSIVESEDFGPQTVGIWDEFFAPPASPNDFEAQAAARIANFLLLAFRGNVSEELLQRYVAFAEGRLRSGEEFTAVMKSIASSAIASPKFLYIYNSSPSENSANELNLASRLSFFLWGSIPDAKLLELAANSELSATDELEKQVQRMLDDRRSKRFCDSFPAQWLQLERIISSVPDRSSFPEFYFAKFRVSMHMMLEPLLVFETIFIEDRPIRELLHSNFSYRSDLLSNWYALKAGGRKTPTVLQFDRVSVDDPRQGGIFTTAAVMTMTSGPSETKPITRGAWFASVILNDPPEPPPADVPPLAPTQVDTETLTIRERLSAHREHQACAGCHNQLDPLGFALENYDPVGRWRDQYSNNRDVDVTGQIFGYKFKNIEEFKAILLQNEIHFVKAFVRHTLSFALGRQLEPVDALSVENIIRRSEISQFRLRDVLEQIVLSQSFRH